MDESWRVAWADALDELELSVEQAERLLAHDSSTALPPPVQPWRPPAVTGPPPPEQLERARRLLERHLRVTRDLADAVTVTRQQLALTVRMGSNQPPDTPLYVDVSA